MDNIYIAISGCLTSVITAFVTHYLTRRKYMADADGTIIDNMTDALDFYRKLCDDNRERLDSLQALCARQQSEIDKLTDDLSVIKKNICLIDNCLKRTIKKQ